MAMPDLQKIWPEWEIEKQIGRGTYGVVYQAVRRGNDLTSRAAVKVISIPQDPSELDTLRSDGLDLQSSWAYLKLIVDEFVSEIRLLETFKGIQNIVSIEDYKVIEKKDPIGWDIYIRMELLTPFNVYICDRMLTEADIIRLGRDICTALEICGRRNIIHRDIKPENIFVNSFGSFKLGDFGTARNMENLTGGLSQRGTFNYMAPEVVTGASYDATVDVYSLGLVLYRLMNNNRLPFLSEKQLLSPGERRAALDRRIQGEDLPAPCQASPALAQVILKACAFHPQDRYASAGEMRQALEAVAAGTSDAPAPILPEAPAEIPPEEKASHGQEKPKKPRKPSKARRWILWRVAAVAAVGLLLAGYFLLRPTQKRPVSLEIWSYPVKKDYGYGETLDPTGLQVMVTYEDNTWEMLHEGLELSPQVLEATGDVEITVSYGGLTADFPVNVKNHPIALRVASEPDKTVYLPGQELDTSGLTLELVYDDGAVKTYSSDFTCSPTRFSNVGATRITVLCQGFYTEFPVDVVSLTGIQVASPPDQTEYQVGEILRPKGLVVEGLLSNGDTITLEGYTCTPTGFGRTSLDSVTVTYGGFTASFPVSVYQPTGLTVLTPPTKTVYKVGEQLNTRGLTYEVSYSNGTTRVFDSTAGIHYCRIEGNDYRSEDKMTSPGEKTVVVYYKGFEDTFTVTVADSAVDVEAAAPQTQPSEAAASQTDISFENLEVTLGSWYNSSTLEGCNQNGEPVFRCLNLKFDYPEKLRNKTHASISCSWDHVVNGGPTWEQVATWEDSKEGMTYAEFSTYVDSPDAFAYMLMLPDRPDIAGPQSVTIKIGDVEKTVSFTLAYLGDYDTGLGWAIDDISF